MTEHNCLQNKEQQKPQNKYKNAKLDKIIRIIIRNKQLIYINLAYSNKILQLIKIIIHKIHIKYQYQSLFSVRSIFLNRKITRSNHKIILPNKKAKNIFKTLTQPIKIMSQQYQASEQTQNLMFQNLEKLIKNQNYFSCFLQNSKSNEQQPSNPFQKKLFDKNLRRSTMSCGHYNSTTSNNNQECQSQNQNEENKENSRSRHENCIQHQFQDHIYDKQEENQFKPISHNKNTKLTPNVQNMASERQNNHVKLAQSRHTDPFKAQISEIINNFRQQLQYLQQKLHLKVDQYRNQKSSFQLNQKQYQLSQSLKERQIRFMIQNLDKIVGFMTQNCVNLQENIIYSQDSIENSEHEYDQNHKRRKNKQIKEKFMYEIDQEDAEKENISFNNAQINHQYQNDSQNEKKDKKSKNKIMKIKEKDSLFDSNLNIPSTYFIGSHMHTTLDKRQTKRQKNNNKSLYHPNRAQLKNQITNKSNQNGSGQSQQIYYHSKGPANNNMNHLKNPSSATIRQSFVNQSQKGEGRSAKSIYQTVLEEREMKLRMKKKMI